MHARTPVPSGRGGSEKNVSLSVKPYASTSPSPPRSPASLEFTESRGWYVDTVGSPTTFSPVTFMTDSNRSPPTTPSPNTAAVDDTLLGDWRTDDEVSRLAVFATIPSLRKDPVLEAHASGTDSLLARGKPSATSFDSALFSYTTVGSSSTPNSPSPTSPTPPLSSLAASPPIPLPTVRSSNGAEAVSPLEQASVDGRDNTSARPPPAHKTLATCVAPPAVHCDAVLDYTGVSRGLASTFTVKDGVLSLSHLASHLLNGEARGADRLPLPLSRTHDKELSWVPGPLPDVKPKPKKRRGMQQPASPKAASVGPPTATVEAAPPPTAVPPASDDASAKRAPRKRNGKKAEGGSPAASPAVTAPKYGPRDAVPDPADRPLYELVALAPYDTLGNLVQPSTVNASARRSQPLAENAVQPRSEALLAVDDSGEFSLANRAPPDRRSAYSGDGRGLKSVLSQISFLVSDNDGVGSGPPSKRRHVRKPTSQQQRQQQQQDDPSTGVAMKSVAKREPRYEFDLSVRKGVTQEVSSLDDKLLIALPWKNKGEAVPDALPTAEATSAPEAEPKRRRYRQGKGWHHNTTATSTETLFDPLAWWRATRAAAALPGTQQGRPCLWIELSDSYQETHGALLRQLLVYWGCIHRQQHTPGAETFLTTPPRSQRKRQRRSQEWSVATVDSSAPDCGGSGRGHNGVVVLVCPPSVFLEDELRWWTTRAHAAHGFVPPVFGVSVTEGEARVGAPSCTPAELMTWAVLHASCDMRLDPAQSLAVMCTAGGAAAFSHMLPPSHVYDSLERCADMLSSVLEFPSSAQLLSCAGDFMGTEGVDVGSLAAVMATTTCPPEPQLTASVGSEAATAYSPSCASPQDRCFAELCRWNRLAIQLRHRPRRPQLLLHRAPIKTVSAVSADEDCSTVTEKEAAVRARVIPAAAALKTHRRPMSSPSLWITYGLVRPATCNDDTFANAARRDARRLASNPPPVTFLPLHLSALSLFASSIFTRSSFVTAVNVVTAHTRLLPGRSAEYISGYSCVVTGPMRYAVTATVRRYLHVNLSVNATPLLAVVNSATKLFKAGQHKATQRSAPDEEVTEKTMAKAVKRLACTRWRDVLCGLGCTCTPGVYEQVVHMGDGTKVCRHIAELFYYFMRQQFRAPGNGRRE